MLEYEVGLCSVWWCPDGEDIRYFENVTAQTEYFEALVGASGWSRLSNFNTGDNVETVQTINKTDAQSLESLVASNYAVIRRTDAETGEKSYRYFFARCSQLSGYQVRAELTLDDVQTNYFRYKDQINPCIINRAHLNRWVNDDIDGFVKFNGNEDSPLFIPEGQNLAKRPTKISRLNEKSAKDATNNGNKLIWQWLNENIAGWQYIFIDAGTYTKEGSSVVAGVPELGYATVSGTGENDYGFAKSPFFHPGYGCLVKPIYKTRDKNSQKVIYWRSSASSDFYELGVSEFFNLFTNAKAYTYVISPAPPFPDRFNMYDVIIDSNGNLVLTGDAEVIVDTIGRDISRFTLINDQAVFILARQYITHRWECSTFDIDFRFSKSSIVNSARLDKYNPKLLSSNFKTLKLYDGIASYKEYDLQKLNGLSGDIWSVSYATPDINTFYFGFKDQGLYNFETFQSYGGALCEYDGTLPYTVNLLDQYLSNNKNFFNQKKAGYLQQGFDQLLSLNPASLKDVFKTGLSTGSSIYFDKKQTEYTLDNFKNAKDVLNSANGSAILNISLAALQITETESFEDYENSGCYFYAVLEEALPGEVKTEADRMYLYGFSYYRIGKIADFDNIRKYFNYIEADIYSIAAPISSLEEERLKTKFRRGVRFWNSDTVQYDLENYERSLEE